MHTKNIVTSGPPLSQSSKALVLLHSRGANAADILGLAGQLDVTGFSLFAPQATGNSWYPFSFLSPPAQNEPWLSSALLLLKNLLEEIMVAGVPSGNIYVAGFSQGACLALEFAARNAQSFGGVAAFTGGLIGDKIYTENYEGDFNRTPVFIGSANPDAHVPVQRVHDSAALLKSKNADVIEKIYPGMGHTINQDELDIVNKHLFKKIQL